MGMAQVANKYRSIRAACVESVYAARMCRAINDSNMLCMGGWLIGAEMGIEMSKAFLETEFTQGSGGVEAKAPRECQEAVCSSGRANLFGMQLV